MGAPGTPGAGRRTEVRGGGAGCWGGAAVPTQPTLHGIGGGGVGVVRGLLLFFPLSIPLVRNNVVREGRAEGTRGACNVPPRADCGRGNWAKCTPP